MVGLFGNIWMDDERGTGLLGGGPAFMDAMANPQAARDYQPGIMDGLHNFVLDNSNGLLGLGLGLLSGESKSDAWAKAAEGYMTGQRGDFQARQYKAKAHEAQMKRVAAENWAGKLGIPLEVAQGDPDTVLALGRTVQAHRLTKEPTEWERLTQGLSKEEFEQAKRAKLGLSGGAEYGPIGEDDFGNKRYGWIDKRNRTVTPYEDPQRSGTLPTGQTAGAGSTADASPMPPPPPGANPKIWRDEQTKIAANEGKQSEKMRSDLATARRSADSLKTELKVFKDLVTKYGAERAPGPAKSAMQTVYTNIQMQLKNLYELGAITGPDMQILERMIENPTAEGTFEYLGKAYDRSGRTNAQIEQVERIINNSLANAEKNLGGRSGGRSSAPSGGTQGAAGGQTRSGVSWSAR